MNQSSTSSRVMTMLPGHTQNPLPLEYPATRQPVRALQHNSDTAAANDIRRTWEARCFIAA
jgi:hypothetical protein